MPGKEQQITIRTTSCEMSYRWVLPLRRRPTYTVIFSKRIEKSTAFFKVVLHQFGSLKTTILIHFPWKRAYFPLSPKSVKVSLALHSLREPCPRVTAAWFASSCGSCKNANAAHRPQDKRFTFGSKCVPANGNAVTSTANSGKYRFQTCPTHRQGFASPARLTAYFLSLRPFQREYAE